MGGGNFSFFLFFFFFGCCLFLFLLLAAGWSAGTGCLLQGSDWNRVSHPGCPGAQCHSACCGIGICESASGGSPACSGITIFLPQCHKNLFLPPKALMDRGEGDALAGRTMALSSHLTVALPLLLLAQP